MTIKKIINIFSYIIVPILLLIITLNNSLFNQNMGDVYFYGKYFGYIAIYILFIILYSKPISIILLKTKNTYLQRINKIFIFIMLYRRQFGILVFYFAFFHGFGYILLQMQKNIMFFEFFSIYIFPFGITSLIALFVGYITSNNYSIKLLKNNRIKIQKIAYIALYLGIIHIFLINKTHGSILLIISIIYGVLRVYVSKKVL